MNDFFGYCFVFVKSSWKCNVLESNEASQQVNKTVSQQTNPRKKNDVYPDVFNAIRFVGLLLLSGFMQWNCFANQSKHNRMTDNSIRTIAGVALCDAKYPSIWNTPNCHIIWQSIKINKWQYYTARNVGEGERDQWVELSVRCIITDNSSMD